ncbi:hypothetical protein JI752_006805 [Lysobacter sp. MMG2]|uniref:hypothetical protein n=1 Tax=Lysobacter sp. MMG2 TaxID=2801338 RepID=UPI001C22A7E4|nr:hypothetical protein [Lysobacter sp. MMG2]MBU8975849.1 hypothetical protein [Lysobacter sp. MMG2]
MTFVVLLACAGPAMAQAGTQGSVGSSGSTGADADDVSGDVGASPLDAPDPRIKELDEQIALRKKQIALLEEQQSFEKKLIEVKQAEFPVVAVPNVKNGDSTTFDQTAFLANWALSANLPKLLPKDDPPCTANLPTLIVGEGNFAGKMLAAKAINETVNQLQREADAWLSEARSKAGRKDGDGTRESGLISGFTVAQSLVTQTLDLMKYFRTDIEFKGATVSLPSHSLRSALVKKCPGGRLPEMAAPEMSELLKTYAALLVAGERIRTQLSDEASQGMGGSLKSRGLAIVASVDALKGQLSSGEDGRPNAIAEAAQLLAQTDAKRLLTVRVLDQGGAIYKRTNLFFLSPKVSYLASATVDYVLSNMSNGQVLWHETTRVKTQLNQSFARWSENPAEAPDVTVVD